MTAPSVAPLATPDERPPAPASPRDPRLDRWALLLLAGLTLFHVAYAGWLSLSPQEAYYWSWAKRPDLSYFDHPPLAAWTIAATTALLGDGERAVRLAAAFHSVVFALFLWLSGRRLFGSRVALAALAAGLAAPLFALGQVIVTPDGPLLSGWAMAFYFTVRALGADRTAVPARSGGDGERPRWLLATGAAVGWALLGKYTAALLLPQILAALLLDVRGRRMLRTPWPWLGLALAAALSSPVVLWNASHRFSSIAFQTSDRVASSGFRPVLVGRFLGLQAGLVTPILLVLLVEGTVQAIRRRREASFRLCAIFAAPLLVLAALISPFHWVKGNWLAAAYPTALLAAAALAIQAYDRVRAGERGAPRWRWGAAVAAVALAAAGSVYVHAVSIWPAVPFPARDELTTGWKALAERVEAERRAIGPGAFVAGCNYKVSAELGYYLPGRPRTWSSEIAGDHGLQYRIWFDEAELSGRDGLLVLDPREKGTCQRREEACRPLQPLEPLTVRRGDAVVTTFQLFRCHWAGPPPALAAPSGG